MYSRGLLFGKKGFAHHFEYLIVNFDLWDGGLRRDRTDLRTQVLLRFFHGREKDDRLRLEADQEGDG